MVGVAFRVLIQLEQWKGHVEFTVVQLNDFEDILGKYFLRRDKAVLIPFEKRLVILDGCKPCVACTKTKKHDGNV